MTTPLRSHAIVVVSGAPVKPPLLQVSVEPTAGVPEMVGGATGDRDAWPAPQPRRRGCGGPACDLLPALSIASACQGDRLADRRGRRRVAELEREDLGRADERAVGVEVDLVHVAAVVVGGHVGLDRIGRGRGEALGGPLEADDRRRRGVGRGRQQVVQAALEVLAAVGVGDLLEAEAERHGVTRRDDRAAGRGVGDRGGVVGLRSSPGAAARCRRPSCAGAPRGAAAAAACRRRPGSGRPWTTR